jgi:hypothetical protein
VSLLLGLAGFARSGKDAAAAALVADGWERRAFADPLKEMLYILNPLLPSGYRVQQLVNAFGWDNAKVEPEVRSLIQRLRTEAGRGVLGEDVWVRATMFAYPRDRDVVLSDVCFENEAEAIRAAGGRVIRIVRPGVEAVNGHVSERALVDSGFDFDHVLVNDGTLEQLHSAIREVAGRDASTLTGQA